ncbi:hypothetical protein N0V88_007465 [Collariella sp. IMI 366227]|nr:hypothetical protein N0V88_007465 [Collariella sp. IMI 366227]
MPRRHVGIGAPSWINWKEWDIIYDHGPRKVWKLRDELILKRVPWDINSEAVTHKFLYENTSIPIPRVHDEWLSPDRVYYYLLEGYIEGVTLADCWPRLTRQQKCDLAREVTGYMLKLSKFEGAAMQSVSGERLPNNNFVPKVSRSHLSGRWRTDAEIFNNEFYPALRNAGVDRATIETLQRMMPPCQSELVLTHCDLYVGNVMVCPSTAQVTAIIDWESCGFWPKWFQYARMTHGCSRDDSEWKELLSRAHKDIIPFAAEGRSAGEGVAEVAGEVW